MEELLAAAAAARRHAHAPYSRFAVGAALRAESGRVFSGANVECASFPEGWCAETSALAAMVAAGERRLSEALVLAEAEAPVTPCGGCRQRLAEFGTAETLVVSAGPQGERARWRLGELLPAAFGLVP
jgi:cytidine deaminase